MEGRAANAEKGNESMALIVCAELLTGVIWSVDCCQSYVLGSTNSRIAPGRKYASAWCNASLAFADAVQKDCTLERGLRGVARGE